MIVGDLLDRWPDGRWLSDLWDLTVSTRPPAWHPKHFGILPTAETPRDLAARRGTVFDRHVPPPAAFLRWLVKHPQRMDVADGTTFLARSDEDREWRRKLFSPDARLCTKAQREALSHLTALGAEGSRLAWWAFEGFSHIDCCVVTDRFVLCVDDRRADVTAASTPWFRSRSRLWHLVEAVQQFARGRAFGVILGVETETQGLHALDRCRANVTASYPHLAPEARAELADRLLGFVAWPTVADRFGVSPQGRPHAERPTS